ncbi:Uncharacterised protein [Klebsiella michiganensis]|nr:Uncharacterised protein [Klebsiella michiganensis]SBM22674.1 Uncharacterised protein [Klebsiella michiganensis]
MPVSNSVLVHRFHAKLHRVLFNDSIHKRHLFMKRITKADIDPPSPVGITFTRQPFSNDCRMVFQFYVFRSFGSVDVCRVDAHAVTKVSKKCVEAAIELKTITTTSGSRRSLEARKPLP